MTQEPNGWALWRLPGGDKVFWLKGPVEILADAEQPIGGFWVHPFEGDQGYLIRGASEVFYQLPSDTQVYPGSGFIEDDEGAYAKRLQSVLDAIHAHEAEKVVFSRRHFLDRGSFSRDECMHSFWKLVDAYPSAFVSLIALPSQGTWLTATPEVLCRKEEGIYKTMALAGTQVNKPSSSWGHKELREQGIVTEFISQVLVSLGTIEIQTSPLHDVEVGEIKHLRTEFSFKGSFNLAMLAKALHPTPAVGGLPQDTALAIIRKYELSPRSLYAGYLGYLPYDPDEDAALFVHLRCACLTSPRPTLFAGGGILADSDITSEWNETEAKLQVLLPYL